MSLFFSSKNVALLQKYLPGVSREVICRYMIEYSDAHAERFHRDLKSLDSRTMLVVLNNEFVTLVRSFLDHRTDTQTTRTIARADTTARAETRAETSDSSTDSDYETYISDDDEWGTSIDRRTPDDQRAATPSAATPSAATPSAPTPSAPTPPAPTPSAATPQAPTPNKGRELPVLLL
jgi:hypothetical protein